MPRQKIRLKIGARFGRLTIEKECRDRKHQRIVLTECDCGRKIKTQLRHLKSGHTKSCGCIRDWTPEKSIRRLSRAIQSEINEINKYEAEDQDWSKVWGWLHQRARELDKFNVYGDGDGKFGVIPACSN